METYPKITIPFTCIKKGMLNRLVATLINSCYGTIEHDNDHQCVKYTARDFTELKIALKKIDKYVLAK